MRARAWVVACAFVLVGTVATVEVLHETDAPIAPEPSATGGETVDRAERAADKAPTSARREASPTDARTTANPTSFTALPTLAPNSEEFDRQVDGIVVDAMGVPVHGASITGYRGALRRDVMTDSAGKFHIGIHPRADVPLAYVEREGFARVLLRIPDHENPWRIVLDSCRAVDVAIVNHRGEPMSDVVVRVDYGKGDDERRTDSRGTATFTVPIEREVRVLAEKSGFVLEHGGIGLGLPARAGSASAFERESLTLRMWPAIGGTFTVHTKSGLAVPFVCATATWDRDGHHGVTCATGTADGVLSFPAIPLDLSDLKLSVYHPWFATMERHCDPPTADVVETIVVDRRPYMHIQVVRAGTNERVEPEEIRSISWPAWPAFDDTDRASAGPGDTFRADDLDRDSTRALRNADGYDVPFDLDTYERKTWVGGVAVPLPATRFPFMVEVVGLGNAVARTELLWIADADELGPFVLQLERSP